MANLEVIICETCAVHDRQSAGGRAVEARGDRGRITSVPKPRMLSSSTSPLMLPKGPRWSSTLTKPRRHRWARPTTITKWSIIRSRREWLIADRRRRGAVVRVPVNTVDSALHYLDLILESEARYGCRGLRVYIPPPNSSASFSVSCQVLWLRLPVRE